MLPTSSAAWPRRAPKLKIERVGQNIVARTDYGRARRVVLGGHLDTVPPNGNESPRREGDVLHGLGTADMKGGLAVLLTVAARASRTAPKHDATFVFYEGEEVADEHNGLRHLFEQRRELVEGDLAVLLEPTGGWVEAGCQGTIHVARDVRGCAGAFGPTVDGRRTRFTAPRRCCNAWPTTTRRSSTSTALNIARRYKWCACKAGSRTTSCPTAAKSW